MTNNNKHDTYNQVPGLIPAPEKRDFENLPGFVPMPERSDFEQVPGFVPRKK